jgi:hypothetical protein
MSPTRQAARGSRRCWRAGASPPAQPEEVAVEHLAAEELHGAMEALPAEERRIVTLHYFEQLTDRQASEALYCSESTFRRRRQRALRRLGALLGVPAPEPGSELAIEIGLAAWVSLRGADVALAHGLPAPLAGILERGREGASWLLDRAREGAARLGNGGGGEGIAASASGPAAKVIGGCAGAVAVCAIGGAIVTGVGGAGSPHHQGSRPRSHGRSIARSAPRPTMPAPEPAVSRPAQTTGGGATGTQTRQRPSKATRRRRARKAEERQVEEQMSAMSRIAREAESESTSGAEGSVAPADEAVTVTPSSGGSSSSEAAAEEEQAEKQFGAFK